MGLDVDRHARALGQSTHALEEGNALGHRVRAGAGQDIDVIGRLEPGDAINHHFELIECVGICFGHAAHAMGAKEFVDRPGVAKVGLDVHGDTVEAGIANHLELAVERPFLPIGPAALHRPCRLVDQQFLHAEVYQITAAKKA